MQFSPTVRTILGALAVTVATLSTALAAFETIPPAVGVVLTVLSAVLGFLLAPPQLGGTQQGLANSSLTEPPPADVERGTASSAIGGFKQGDVVSVGWPVAAIPLAADRIGTGEVLFWLVVFFVIACFIGAFYLIFNLGQILGGVALAVVGVLAAAVFLI